MKTLLEKLNYKGQKRVAIINPESKNIPDPFLDIKDVMVDSEIDQRYAYDFIMIFVSKVTDVRKITPVALHNLTADGILWFCYPKKSSKKFMPDIDRDHGWKSLNDLNFHGIRMISMDEDWSAIRFRNVKYIKSKSKRFAIPKGRPA